MDSRICLFIDIIVSLLYGFSVTGAKLHFDVTKWILFPRQKSSHQ